MQPSRLVAAVFTALFIVVPAAHAQGAVVDQSTPTDVQSVDVAVESQPASVKVIQATVTGYASGADNGAVGSMTASGVRTHWGTVAADWRLYPSGTRLQIEGFPNETFTVEDMGGAVRGNIFDIWFPDLPTAVAFGTKTLRVTVLAGPER